MGAENIGACPTKVSVVIATYNGEAYIRDQMTSILDQLREGDEVIVSDDGSADATLDIAKSIGDDYSHIEIVFLSGPGMGTPSNFAHGLSAVTGDIVFFADQDDVWLPGKRDDVCAAFANNPSMSLVTHDAFCEYPDGTRAPRSIFEDRNARHGFVRNLARSTYFGCCMAARSPFVKRLIPIIASTNAHDQFISLVAEMEHASFFLREPLLIHRLHGDNQSQKLSVVGMIGYRIRLCISILKDATLNESALPKLSGK